MFRELHSLLLNIAHFLQQRSPEATQWGGGRIALLVKSLDVHSVNDYRFEPHCRWGHFSDMVPHSELLSWVRNTVKLIEVVN